MRHRPSPWGRSSPPSKGPPSIPVLTDGEGGPRLCPCPFTPCFAVSVCLYNTHICTRKHMHTRTRAHTQDDSNSMRASEGEVGHAGEGCFSLFPCVFIPRAEHVTGCPVPAPRAAFLRVTTTWRTSHRRTPLSCLLSVLSARLAQETVSVLPSLPFSERPPGFALSMS